MISNLTGTLEAMGDDWVVVNVGGVGFKVFVPNSDLSQIGSPGGKVKLFTHLHVREDNISLFGSTSQEELGLFEVLIGVSGIGPKLALAMLSVMEPEKLAAAIATSNSLMLTRIPGIGKKTAERIILELKDKVSAGMLAISAPELAPENAEVLAALVSLGYSTSEAAQAVSSLPRDSKLGLEEKIRLALSYYGGK
ncbi:MAG: Holliday junction branch migration protein RuvA [Dehalococcoidia bacterium]|nr:MAG: Holliday junction branch migration protein RuvA [Dehalococcoidia bacterium]